MEEIKDRQPYFDKTITGLIKGIALIMMFVHHFFTFPEWWVESISYPVIENYGRIFRMPFGLCVSVFCFLTGYFYGFSKDRSYRYSVKKIINILITYWCVFIIFVILGVSVCHCSYSITDIIKEALGIDTPTMFFCWYVDFYIAFMLILPLITKIMSKNIYLDLFIGIAAVPAVFSVIEHFVSNPTAGDVLANLEMHFPVALMGYIFASYGIFEKIQDLNKRLIKSRVINGIFIAVMALMVCYGQGAAQSFTFSIHGFYFTLNMDIIYAPLFIYALVYMCRGIKFKPVKDVLFQIGKYSLLMWFISCIFFGKTKEIFQPVLYFPKNPLLVLIWGLLICFGAAFVLDKPIKKITVK